MIARMWRGWVATEKAAEYVEIVERTGMSGYRRTPGNEGAQLLTRDLGDGRTEMHFQTTTEATGELFQRMSAGIESAFGRLEEVLR